MLEIIKDFYKAISIIDLIYLILTILSLINCYKKGFILSILSMAKWLLAYIITLILFPKIKLGEMKKDPLLGANFYVIQKEFTNKIQLTRTHFYFGN